MKVAKGSDLDKGLDMIVYAHYDRTFDFNLLRWKLEGKSIRNIAKDLKSSPSTICRLTKRAVDNLKEDIGILNNLLETVVKETYHT